MPRRVAADQLARQLDHLVPRRAHGAGCPRGARPQRANARLALQLRREALRLRMVLPVLLHGHALQLARHLLRLLVVLVRRHRRRQHFAGLNCVLTSFQFESTRVEQVPLVGVLLQIGRRLDFSRDCRYFAAIHLAIIHQNDYF